MLLRDVLILASCGSVGYAWLCAVASPLGRAIRSIVRRGVTRRGWGVFGLAVAAAVLWTAIGGAAIVLSMMLEPRVGLALVRSRLFWPGILLGDLVWTAQLVLTARAPRFGPTFEMASALATVALVSDDPRILARVRHDYAAHVVGDAPVSRALYGGLPG